MTRDKIQEAISQENERMCFLIIFLSGVMYPAWSIFVYFFAPTVVDKPLERLSLSAFYILLGTLTLKITVLRKWMYMSSLVVSLLTVGHLMTILYRSNGHFYYMLGIILAVLGYSSVFRKKWMFYAFYLFLHLQLVAFYFLPDASKELLASVSYLMFGLPTAALCIGVLIFSRLSLEGKIIDLAKQVEENKEREWHSNKKTTLSRIAGGLAHEINNPLAIINGAARRILRLEYLTDEIGKKELAKMVDKIIANSSRIELLVNRILTLSTIGSKINQSNKSIAVIWEQVIRDLTERETTVKIESESSIHSDCPQVPEEPMRIVMVNLLENAINESKKFKNPDPVRAKLLIKQGFTSVNISNQSDGVPLESLEVLSDPFFTKSPGHQGLGLTQAINLLDHLGGNLEYSHDGIIHQFSFKLESCSKSDVAVDHRSDAQAG